MSGPELCCCRTPRVLLLSLTIQPLRKILEPCPCPPTLRVIVDRGPQSDLVFLSKMYNHKQRLMRWALLMQWYNIEVVQKRWDICTSGRGCYGLRTCGPSFAGSTSSLPPAPLLSSGAATYCNQLAGVKYPLWLDTALSQLGLRQPPEPSFPVSLFSLLANQPHCFLGACFTLLSLLLRFCLFIYFAK